jgi:MarR family transcriptional regulator, organic hydroperoxide resistance regulator
MKSDLKFRFGSKEESPDYLLWQVYSQWQRGKSKLLEQHELTSPQLTLLASILWLTEQKEDVTQILLSTNANIDRMTTSTVLRTLQDKGLVSRQEHATDTRAKTVALTASGKKITVLALQEVSQYNKKYFSALGTSVKQFNKSLLNLLTQNKNE